LVIWLPSCCTHTVHNARLQPDAGLRGGHQGCSSSTKKGLSSGKTKARPATSIDLKTFPYDLHE
jgi:hypothetical protein